MSGSPRPRAPPTDPGAVAVGSVSLLSTELTPPLLCAPAPRSAPLPFDFRSEGSNIEVGPSIAPKKKYSDISGLEAEYTDPKTKLRYATVEEYKRVKEMPYDLVQATLALRRANVVFR